MPEKCHVNGCSAPVVARNFCDTHYRRWKRHGHAESTRAEDYGKRHAHPAYSNWKSVRHNYPDQLPKTWVEDFWAFVADIPEKPEPRAWVMRKDTSKPFSSGNFYWRVSSTTDEEKADHKLYMRNWQRRMRAANPRYGKDSFLRRKYGVTLEWYDAQHERQNGLCGICSKPETAVIGGKVLQLAVDHCHEHGHTRLLLCSACNTALGLFQDDPNLLRKAADYLDSHKALW